MELLAGTYLGMYVQHNKCKCKEVQVQVQAQIKV